LHEAPKRNKADFGGQQQIIFQATGELAGPQARCQSAHVTIALENDRAGGNGDEELAVRSGKTKPLADAESLFDFSSIAWPSAISESPRCQNRLVSVSLCRPGLRPAAI